MVSWQFKLYKLLLRLQFRGQVLDGSRPIETERANQERMLSFLRLPSACATESLMVAGVPAEWIDNPTVDNGRIILYLHGGAYCLCSINTHRTLAAYIGQAANAKTLIIDYRLAPEHHHPAALEDATAVYKWCLDEGYDPQKIAIVGDSAGGGLTLATLLALREQNVPMPGTAVCLSPWVDLLGSGNSMQNKVEHDPILSPKFLQNSAKMYTNGHKLENPFISPLYASFHNLPPLLIQVGTNEILLDDAVRLAEKAKVDGVEVTLDIWPEMFHVWQMASSFLPEAKTAVSQIGEFIQTHTTSS